MAGGSAKDTNFEGMTCSMCQNMYLTTDDETSQIRTPCMVFGCWHTFCRPCLVQWARSKQHPRGQFTCSTQWRKKNVFDKMQRSGLLRHLSNREPEISVRVKATFRIVAAFFESRTRLSEQTVITVFGVTRIVDGGRSSKDTTSRAQHPRPVNLSWAA